MINKWNNKEKDMGKEIKSPLENGRVWSPVRRWVSLGDLMYSMVTVINNTVLYICKLLKRVDLKNSHCPTKKKKNCNYVRCWMCHLNLFQQSFHSIYIYLVSLLYTLTLHNVIDQLYLNKAGGGREDKLEGGNQSI